MYSQQLFIYHSVDEIWFFQTSVAATLRSVYLGTYRGLNMGNLNVLKERKTPGLSD